MPNLDGGHYFLTILVPVKVGQIDPNRVDPISHLHALRSALSRLAPARQSAATEEARSGNSPFARSLRTHFARFFIIEDVAYNGRDERDALINVISPKVLTDPQPVDRLTSPFLGFIVDFDPDTTGTPEPDSYLDHLWTEMQTELREVFQHCVGFEAVHDGPGFAAYLKRGQLETTMPFNDYWIQPPPLPSLLGPKTKLLLAGVAVGIVGVAALAGHYAQSWLLGGAVGLGLIVAAIFCAYLIVMRTGARPFPAAPGSDLKSVLKSLYLQQKFTNFVIANQTSDPAQLLANFRSFAAAHAPGDLDRATQSPGVIRS